MSGDGAKVHLGTFGYCKSSYPETSADYSVVLKNSGRGLLLRVAYVDVSIQPGIKHYHHRHTCLWLECILLPEGAANVRTKNTVQSQTPLDVHSQNRVQGTHTTGLVIHHSKHPSYMY